MVSHGYRQHSCTVKKKSLKKCNYQTIKDHRGQLGLKGKDWMWFNENGCCWMEALQFVSRVCSNVTGPPPGAGL